MKQQFSKDELSGKGQETQEFLSLSSLITMRMVRFQAAVGVGN